MTRCLPVVLTWYASRRHMASAAGAASLRKPFGRVHSRREGIWPFLKRLVLPMCLQCLGCALAFRAAFAADTAFLADAAGLAAADFPIANVCSAAWFFDEPPAARPKTPVRSARTIASAG